MTYQFDEERIVIQPFADGIGPFNFDLSGQLPPNGRIKSVAVVAALKGVDTTTALITEQTLSGNTVGLKFKYPGADKQGTHKLTFKYTLESGGKDEADFYGVLVVDI